MGFFLPVSVDDETNEIIQKVEKGKRSAFVCEAIKEKGEREFLTPKAKETIEDFKAKQEKELEAVKAKLEAQTKAERVKFENAEKLQTWKVGYIDLINSEPEEDVLKQYQEKARKAGVLVAKKKDGAGFKITAKLL
jgi:hypothetical protein